MRLSISALILGVLFSSAVLLLPSAHAAIIDVDIVEFDFTPGDITINVGDTVRWTNQGSIVHTTTSNTMVWDSGSLSTGQQFEFLFTEAGTFAYFCIPHPWMVGSVEVKPALASDTSTISASTGGMVNFTLDGGASLAGRSYALLGTASGTTPGTPLPGGATLPLNQDFVFQFIKGNFNNAFFVNFLGAFDANGQAAATFNIPFPLPAALPPGTTLHFAYTTIVVFDHQSEPLAVSVVQ